MSSNLALWITHHPSLSLSLLIRALFLLSTFPLSPFFSMPHCEAVLTWKHVSLSSMSVGCGWASEQERGGLWDCGVEWEELSCWTKERGRTWIAEWWRGKPVEREKVEGVKSRERAGPLPPLPRTKALKPPLLWWLCVNTTSPPVWPTKQLSFNTQN